MANSTKFIDIDLDTSNMPLLSINKPHTAVYADATASSSKVNLSTDQPGLMYAHNVLPTARGLVATKPYVFANNQIAKSYAVPDLDPLDKADYSMANSLKVKSFYNYWGVAFTAVFFELDNVFYVDWYAPVQHGHSFIKRHMLFDINTAHNDYNADIRQEVGEPVTTSIDAIAYKGYRILVSMVFTFRHETYGYLLCNNITKELQIREGNLEHVSIGDSTKSGEFLPNGEVVWSNAINYSSLPLRTAVQGDPDGFEVYEIQQVVKGFLTYSSYIIGYNTEGKVYWSAPNTVDFIPSTITGAGYAVPAVDLGDIITGRTTATGFNLFYSGGIINAKYTGNTQFPFKFSVLSYSAGIQKATDVTDSYPAYAATSEGVAIVDDNAVSLDFSQLTDFLTAGVYEDYTTELVTTVLDAPLDYKLTTIGDRFLCASYKPAHEAVFKFVIIVDLQLKKYGKVKVDHFDVFKINYKLLGDLLAYDEMYFAVADITDPNDFKLAKTDITYENLQGVSSTLLRKHFGTRTADPKYVLGILTSDAYLAVIDPSYNAPARS